MGVLKRTVEGCGDSKEGKERKREREIDRQIERESARIILSIGNLCLYICRRSLFPSSLRKRSGRGCDLSVQ